MTIVTPTTQGFVFCNAWSTAVNQAPSGNDIPRLSGIPIAEFALVGELLRVCPAWQPVGRRAIRALRARTY